MHFFALATVFLLSAALYVQASDMDPNKFLHLADLANIHPDLFEPEELVTLRALGSNVAGGQASAFEHQLSGANYGWPESLGDWDMDASLQTFEDDARALSAAINRYKDLFSHGSAQSLSRKRRQNLKLEILDHLLQIKIKESRYYFLTWATKNSLRLLDEREPDLNKFEKYRNLIVDLRAIERARFKAIDFLFGKVKPVANDQQRARLDWLIDELQAQLVAAEETVEVWEAKVQRRASTWPALQYVLNGLPQHALDDEELARHMQQMHLGRDDSGRPQAAQSAVPYGYGAGALPPHLSSQAQTDASIMLNGIRLGINEDRGLVAEIDQIRNEERVDHGEWKKLLENLEDDNKFRHAQTWAAVDTLDAFLRKGSENLKQGFDGNWQAHQPDQYIRESEEVYKLCEKELVALNQLIRQCNSLLRGSQLPADLRKKFGAEVGNVSNDIEWLTNKMASIVVHRNEVLGIQRDPNNRLARVGWAQSGEAGSSSAPAYPAQSNTQDWLSNTFAPQSQGTQKSRAKDKRKGKSKKRN